MRAWPWWTASQEQVPSTSLRHAYRIKFENGICYLISCTC